MSLKLSAMNLKDDYSGQLKFFFDVSHWQHHTLITLFTRSTDKYLTLHYVTFILFIFTHEYTHTHT